MCASRQLTARQLWRLAFSEKSWVPSCHVPDSLALVRRVSHILLILFIKLYIYIENFATAVVARRNWGQRRWADQRTSSGGPSELRILRRILALTSARTSAAAAAPGSPPGLCKHLARAAHSERRWKSRRARTSNSTQGAVKSGACHAGCSKRGAWCLVRGAWCVVRGACWVVAMRAPRVAPGVSPFYARRAPA